ncbi:E3 ubiquitin-protein ligase TRIM71-like [Dysidea avara]|uniref:E3 ubiquitin-protein ligase TRIM71-like n=1 Tax=Dysidea avara TaxID=196820 RepID=UPI00332A5419
MGLAFSSDNKLFVVDSDNFRVQVFQQGGIFMFSFGGEGDAPGQFQYPVTIAVDVDNGAVSDLHDGYIIANSDGDDDKIKVWNSDHQLIVQFGNKGSQLGEFYSILGMALDHNRVLYVAEGVNQRLKVVCNV